MGDLKRLVHDELHIDEYKSKMGDDADVCVILSGHWSVFLGARVGDDPAIRCQHTPRSWSWHEMTMMLATETDNISGTPCCNRLPPTELKRRVRFADNYLQ